MGKLIIEDPELDKTECTDSPFWIIIDPKQIMSKDVDAIANCITGFFFSRESATHFLKNNSHNYSKNAVVYCHSAWRNYSYKKQWNIAQREYLNKHSEREL